MPIVKEIDHILHDRICDAVERRICRQYIWKIYIAWYPSNLFNTITTVDIKRTM